MPINGNGQVFREKVALIPSQEAKRLHDLGAAIFQKHELELIGNTAVQVAREIGCHPTVMASLIAAGVVADMVIRAVRETRPEPKEGEPLDPLLDKLARGLNAARIAQEVEKAKEARDERAGKPIEEGEDIVLRARRSGLVIAG